MADELDIVESLDREAFDSVKTNRGFPPAAQTKAVRAMKHGDIIAVTHEGFAPCKSSSSTTCSLVGSVRYGLKQRRPDAIFVMKHLPDGRLGVACHAKEEQS